MLESHEIDNSVENTRIPINGKIIIEQSYIGIDYLTRMIDI